MNETEPSSEPHHHPKWVKYTLEINSGFIVLINLYVMVLIARKKSHLSNICNIFLLALLTSHLGIGVVGLFMFNINTAINGSPFDHKNMFELMTVCIYQIFSISTFCMIMLVTIDRLIAIKKPYVYSELTWKFCVWSILIIMIFPVIYIISEMNSKTHIYNFLLFCKAMASIVLAVSHHLIYREVQRQFKEIAKLIVCDDKIIEEKKRNELHKRSIRSTRSCYFIVLSNIIFWLPCGISFILVLATSGEDWAEIILQFRYAAHIFENLNSLKDPLMYAILNKDLKIQIQMDKKNISGMRYSKKTDTCVIVC